MQSGITARTFGTAMARLRLRGTGTVAAAVLIVTLGPVLAVLTFLVMGPLDQGASSPFLRAVILADLVYVLVIAALVLQRVAQMIAARRAKSAGSRLHLRLTGVFAIVALLPTVLVAVFATITVNFGLEGWFSDRVQRVVGASLSAAEAYEDEKRVNLSEDALAVARALDQVGAATAFVDDGELRQMLGQAQGRVQRGLREAYLIDGTGALRVRGERSYDFDFERPTPEQIAEARGLDGPLIIEDWQNSEFRALIPLQNHLDRYLYVSREVDGQILTLLDETQETVQLYQQLESERGQLLFQFGLIYLGFAVILILAATWIGLWFAERLARPVGRLAGAAQRVGAGDFGAKVPVAPGDDEIAMLGRSFNQMTTQLAAQRDALMENTRQIEARRRLFDSVLGSVSAGVIGLDAEGRVDFANRSAAELLDLEVEAVHGTALATVVPEFAALLSGLPRRRRAVVQEQIRVTRRGKPETLLVRAARRFGSSGESEGIVIAFDDVSDLVSAQRMAAWGDVARRIAHEIKNPLTPIQLSAERLRRKFAPMVGDEAEALSDLTGVIVRQTDDLRRIVDEFSKFARMPEPELRLTDFAQLVRDVVLLQQSGQPEIEIVAEVPGHPIRLDLDGTMVSQAITNLMKNAGEAIETRAEKGDSDFPRQIAVSLRESPEQVELSISDTGIGLPEDVGKLFEPYVTTRDKGTGLGLPIVRKIIEQHEGKLRLDPAEPDATGHRGARAVITLPRPLETQAAAE